MTDVAVRNDALHAEINYLAAGSFVNRRFVAPAREVNTGRYEAHQVIVRDARPQRAAFTLDSHGFTLLDHRSAVGNFLDREEVDAIYPAEVVATISPPPQDCPLALCDGRVPHTAFHTGLAGAHPRESIEFRSIAFFS